MFHNLAFNHVIVTVPEQQWQLAICSPRWRWGKTSAFFVPFPDSQGHEVTLDQMTYIAEHELDSFAAMAYLRSQSIGKS